jgi:hypothetical protein
VGDTARLLYATPAAGWRMERDDTSGDRVRVEFLRGDSELEVSGRCEGGRVDAEVKDSGSGSGGDS